MTDPRMMVAGTTERKVGARQRGPTEEERYDRLQVRPLAQAGSGGPISTYARPGTPRRRRGSRGPPYFCSDLLDLPPVERPVLHRFGHVLDSDRVPALEVRDRPCDFEDTVIRSGRETQAVDGLLEESRDRRRRTTNRPHLRGAHVTVRVDPDAIAEARPLDVASPPDSAANFSTPGSARDRCKGIERYRWHVDVEVDPIQKRPGYAAPIPKDLSGVAQAAIGAIPRIAARARVHGRDEQKAGGEADRPSRS